MIAVAVRLPPLVCVVHLYDDHFGQRAAIIAPWRRTSALDDELGGPGHFKVIAVDCCEVGLRRAGIVVIISVVIVAVVIVMFCLQTRPQRFGANPVMDALSVT